MLLTTTSSICVYSKIFLSGNSRHKLCKTVNELHLYPSTRSKENWVLWSRSFVFQFLVSWVFLFLFLEVLKCGCFIGTHSKYWRSSEEEKMSMDWDNQRMLYGIGGVWLGREEQTEMGKSKEVGKGFLSIQYINENNLLRMKGVVGSSGR